MTASEERVRVGGWIPPHITADNEEFWRGVEHEALVVRTCRDCGCGYIPTTSCPRCGSIDSDLGVASGSATLYTWTTTWRSFDPAFDGDVPYVVGIVDLHEGPRIPARLLVGSGADLFVGMPLQLVFERPQGNVVWAFVPDRPRADSVGRHSGAQQ